MGLLVRLALVLIAVLAVLSILRGVLSPRSESNTSRTGPLRGATTGKLVRDPVCGTYIPALGSPNVREGDQTVCFCSEACREKFIASASAS